jgi:hypothetical protein
MTARSHSRGARLRARLRAHRPRTDPSTTPEAKSHDTTLADPSAEVATRRSALSALIDLREQITAAASAACIGSNALVAQAADYDKDVAVILQRCVSDVLARQISMLDSLIARGAS